MQSGGQYGVPDIQQFMMERGTPARLLALPAEIIMTQAALKPRLSLHPHYIPFSVDHHYQHPLSNPVQQHQLQVEEARDEEDVEDAWTAEESLALLRICSELDFKIQDSAFQASFWQDVSRKLAEVGYHRSAKECSENLEKLKKNARNEKSCRQYSEIEAVYKGGNEMNNGGSSVNDCRINIPSRDASMEDDVSPSLEKKNKRKRKRKQLASIKNFFESMVKQLLENQKCLNSKLLEAIERRDQERLLREDAWRRQEMARLTRETELRAQEQALASTREAAIVALLQKISGQHLKLPQAPTSSSMEGIFMDRDFSDVSGKRWPKAEVQALIRLRSSLEPKFQEPGPKGPLWQEISAGMAALGFNNRNAKRCKEKWENINKYFRKTKDTIKKRPENAKTCPYFHQLDALYRKGIISSPSKCNRTDQITNLSSNTLPDNNISKEQEDNEDLNPQDSVMSEEIIPANNSDDVYIFRSPDAPDQAQNMANSNNTVPRENNHISKSSSSDVEVCARRNDYTFSDSNSSISVKMERLMKDFERRQQYTRRQAELQHNDIPLLQNQIKFIQERSESVTQSALMALVDKLSAEITGDYPAKQ